MICPVELASEMSAFWRGPEVELSAGGRHGFLLGVRHGAGDEDTGSDFASDGEKDHLEPGRQRSSASATGRCAAGTSATGSLATTGYSTADCAGRVRSACRWRQSSECWDCT